MYLSGSVPLPHEYGFMPLESLIRGPCPTTRPSGSSSRSTARTSAGSGPTRALLEQAPLVVNIDHHHDNSRFGHVNFVVADASSTGEILRDLLAELGVELTPEIAEALYIALVTDTGRFQYANTTPKALRLAAELVEAGADVHRVFQDVYENVAFAKIKLLARALAKARVLEGGRVIVSDLERTISTRPGPRSPSRRASSTSCAPSRAPSSSPSSASRPRRTARPGGSACARVRRASTSRRSPARAAAAATARPPASRARPRRTRSWTSSAASTSPRPRATPSRPPSLTGHPRADA